MNGAERLFDIGVERDDSALEELRPLVVALKEHHARVAPQLGQLRSDGECWSMTRARYAQSLANGEGAIFVARTTGGEPVGFAFVTPAAESADWDAPAVQIEDIAVAEAARGKGVGHQLVAAVREHAQGRNIRLSVLDANHSARRFYAREGFTEFVRVLLLRPDVPNPAAQIDPVHVSTPVARREQSRSATRDGVGNGKEEKGVLA